MAGWSTTKPEGYTWDGSPKESAVNLENNYYRYRVSSKVGRGKNDKIAFEVVLQVLGDDGAHTAWYPSQVSIPVGASVKVGSGSWENSSSYTCSGKYMTWTSSKTLYWEGTATSADNLNVRGFWASSVCGTNEHGTRAYTSKYKISYNGNGASGGSTASSSDTVYLNNATVAANGFEPPAGYHFHIWNTAANGSGGNKSPGSSIQMTANVTLYAQWAINHYLVSYNGNSPDGTPVTDVPETQDKTHGEDVILSSTEPNCEGFVFSHWNTASDDSGTSYDPGDTFTIDAETVLYAIWDDTYPVTYDGNGATSGYTEEQTKVKDVALTLQPNGFVRDKYTFVQWNTESDGSGTGYDPGDPYGDNAALTLYAIWHKNNIPLFYHDGVDVRQAEKAYIMYQGEVYPVTLYIKKDGYVYEVS